MKKVRVMQNFEDVSFWPEYDENGSFVFENGELKGEHRKTEGKAGELISLVPEPVAQAWIAAKVAEYELPTG